MSARVISADTHIIEPPDIYRDSVPERYAERCPRMKRGQTADGKVFDAWYIGDQVAGHLGLFITAGQRFERPEEWSFLGVWDDVPKAAYDANAFLGALDRDDVSAALVQPTQGNVWYRLDDDDLLSSIFRGSNDWIADFCAVNPTRLRGVGMINVRDPQTATAEMKRCADLGLAALFIAIWPDRNRRYDDPFYEPVWRTANEIELPLLMHIGSYGSGIAGCELVSMDNDVIPSAASRCTTDHWVRYALADLLFSGVFDRYPNIRVGTVEHEAAWIPHWLKQMDFTYRERPVFTKSAVGFIRARSSAPINPVVSAFRRRCSVNTSDCSNNACALAATR